MNILILILSSEFPIYRSYQKNIETKPFYGRFMTKSLPTFEFGPDVN